MANNPICNMTFAGCGYLGMYHIGVVQAFSEKAPDLLASMNNFGGCSAGALAAASALSGCCLADCARRVLSVAKYTRNLVPFNLGMFTAPFMPTFDMYGRLRAGLLSILPDNVHKLVNGKLHVSLTKVTQHSLFGMPKLENVIVSQFESKEELVEALICSAFVPFYSGIIPPKFRGVSYLDGGFTDNLPQHFEGTTITVSPFSGESDICPDDANTNLFHFDFKNTSIQFTSHNLYRMSRAFFPPNTEVLCEMCRQGFRDALKYLHIHYPHLLNLSIERIKMPECCYEHGVDDDRVSIHSCDSESTCEAESAIAERHAIVGGIHPDELNEIFCATGDHAMKDEQWALYLYSILKRLLKWMTRPAFESAENLGYVIHQTIKWTLPRLTKLTSCNRYSAGVVSLCIDVCKTYKGWYVHERHPSLNDEDFLSIKEASDRIKVVSKHLKVVPIRCSSNCVSKVNNSPESDTEASLKFNNALATFSPNIEEYIQKCGHVDIKDHCDNDMNDSYDEFVSDFLSIDDSHDAAIL